MDKELYPRLSELKPKNAPPYWRPEVTWHSHVQPVAACSVHRLPDVSQDGATPESTRIRSPQSSPQTAPQNDPHRSPLSAPSRLSAPQVQQLAPQPQYPYSNHAPTNTTIHQHEWRCAPSPSPSDSVLCAPSLRAVPRYRLDIPPVHPHAIKHENKEWHAATPPPCGSGIELPPSRIGEAGGMTVVRKRVAGSVGALRARQSCVGGTAPVAGRRPHRPSSGSLSSLRHQRGVVRTIHTTTGLQRTPGSTRACARRAWGGGAQGRSAVASLPTTQCGGVPAHDAVRWRPYPQRSAAAPLPIGRMGSGVKSKWTHKWKSGSGSESTRAVTPRATLRPPHARTGSVLARPLRGEGANDKWARKVGVEAGANPTRTRAVTPRAAHLCSLCTCSPRCVGGVPTHPPIGRWNKWQMGAQSESGSGSEPTCRDVVRRSPLSAPPVDVQATT
ncbi:hypothetical protein B0H10DRAFT_2242412 [Mycena sp. CBHHK59/15]|nr:hypothetical protein B0H10DRAFT_2242412 [Mycena sp. CBHHK59/15]